MEVFYLKKIIELIIVFLILSSGSGFTAISIHENKSFLKDQYIENINQDNEVNVLVIIPDRFGANTFFNLDNMELFGWNITLSGLTEIVEPCPGAQSSFDLPEIQVDILIDDSIDISIFDVLAIMPAFWRSGEAYGDLLNSRDALNLISTANENGLIIWATCAGPRVLAAADVINGKNITGRTRFKSEYEASGANYLGENIPPVIDQNIVTCMRGQYWNKENIEAIATALELQNYNLRCELEKNGKIMQTSFDFNNGLWTKTFGGIYSDGGKQVYKSDDDKYIIIGYTYSSEFGNSDMYVVCIDEQGNLLWSSTYGGDGWEYGFGICASHDDGYILTGYSTSFSYYTANSKDVFIVKIDEDGNELWSKTYGGSCLDIGRSICQSDDGYIICGYTESYGSGENDIYVLSIDEEGTIIWDKQYGGSGAELGYQIKKTSDDNYVIIGGSGSDRANYDFYFLKIDDSGNVIWEKYYGAQGGEGGYDRGHAVVETNNGDFIIVGETNYGDALNFILIKTDFNGNLEWSKVYGELLHDHGNDIIETSDGNYVICGRFDISSKGYNDVGILKINTDGDEIWRRTLSMSGSEWATSLIETADNGLLITGHTNSIGSGNYDMMVIKTDSEGYTNQQPNKPSKPSGPTSGKMKETYSYTSRTTDPENENIYYIFDWGDGTDSGWLGPYNSGDLCNVSHSWDINGNYNIKVKARDVNGGESDWSEPLEISMPKTRSIDNNPLLFRLFQRFPILESLL